MVKLKVSAMLAGFLALSLAGSPVFARLNFKPAKCCGGACPMEKGKTSQMPCCKIIPAGNETAKAAKPSIFIYHAVSTAVSTLVLDSYFQPKESKSQLASVPIRAPTGLSPPLA